MRFALAASAVIGAGVLVAQEGKEGGGAKPAAKEADVPALALMADSVHKHGSLAGIELSYNGFDAPNLYSRVPSLAPSSMGTIGGSGYDPVQTRRMDKEDIRNVRKWHRQAALRAPGVSCHGVGTICVVGHVMPLVPETRLRSGATSSAVR